MDNPKVFEAADATRVWTKAQARMAALRIEPILVEESDAAALCCLSVERLRIECPLRPAMEGRRRLMPVQPLREWAHAWWAKKSGYSVRQEQGAADEWDAENDAKIARARKRRTHAN